VEARETNRKVSGNGEKNRGGRPTKKTPEAVAPLLEVARSGLPVRFICASIGISQECLGVWRERDREFALAFEQARLESVERRWKQILEAGTGTEDRPGDWRSIAWSLERTYPSEFARPEIQFQLNNTYAPSMTTNQNVVIMVPERAKALADRSQILEAQVDELLGSPSKSEAAVQGEQE
jgi:hypothetical protein